MSKIRTTVLTALIAVVLLSTVSVLTVSDDSSAAPAPIISVDTCDGAVGLKAGSSSSFDVLVTNSNAFIDHDISEDILVTLSAKITDASGKAVNDLEAVACLKNKDGVRAHLNGQESADFRVTMTAGSFIDRGTYKVTYTFTVTNLSGDALGDPVSVTRDVELSSDTAASTYYNKFCGVYENNLDGMFGEVWFTALASFFIILAIGVIVSLIASPIIAILTTTKTSPDRKTLRKSMFRIFTFAFAVFGIFRAICVFGLTNENAALLDTVCGITYVLVVAFIAWKIYGAFLDRIAERIQSRDNRDGLDNFLSFKPLFIYLGKIVTAIVVVFAIMSMFGFDLAAIITSAGLITLGITFGAQQILSQFFAGLLLLTTRPFKKGDLIQLGGSEVYRVRKVNVMNTELENWDNSDVTIVPNNSLTSSSVKNITRDTLRTKAYIYVGVGYGADLDQARALMVESANENGHVLKEAAVAPSTRIMDFQDSNILLRLCVWVDDFNVALGVAGEIRDAMYKKFNAVGVPIDYPQVVLHKAAEKDD